MLIHKKFLLQIVSITTIMAYYSNNYSSNNYLNNIDCSFISIDLEQQQDILEYVIINKIEEMNLHNSLNHAIDCLKTTFSTSERYNPPSKQMEWKYILSRAQQNKLLRRLEKKYIQVSPQELQLNSFFTGRNIDISKVLPHIPTAFTHWKNKNITVSLLKINGNNMLCLNGVIPITSLERIEKIPDVKKHNGIGCVLNINNFRLKKINLPPYSANFLFLKIYLSLPHRRSKMTNFIKNLTPQSFSNTHSQEMTQLCIANTYICNFDPHFIAHFKKLAAFYFVNNTIYNNNPYNNNPIKLNIPSGVTRSEIKNITHSKQLIVY